MVTDTELEPTVELPEDTMIIHATLDKVTKNYRKYIPLIEEDPPEFLPNNGIYIGKHLEGIKRVIIELEEGDGVSES